MKLALLALAAANLATTVTLTQTSTGWDVISWVLQLVAGRESGPQGVFELRLNRFHNYRASDIQGNCCQGLKTEGRCGGRCHTLFRVCLKHYQATVDYDQGCTFGEEITPVLGTNNLTITRQPIKFDINFKWPVSIH